MKPAISILLRNKNSESTLAEVLKSLFNQSFTDFELIVADSGSTDHSLEWLQAYPHRLIQIAPQDYFPGKVLNQLAHLAQGDILVYLNSDVVMLDQDCLLELLKPFADSTVQASFARQIARPEADSWVQRDYIKAFPAEGTAPEWMRYSLPLAAMRKSAWTQMPFYSWAWGSEDSEWGQRAAKRDWKVTYVPTACVMHSHNYTLDQLAGRRFIEGEADAFMHQSAYPMLKFLPRVAADSLRDLKACLSQGDLKGAVQALPRRWVFHRAHLKGWQHGWHRLQSGSADSQLGQQFVLQRHPARA